MYVFQICTHKWRNQTYLILVENEVIQVCTLMIVEPLHPRFVPWYEVGESFGGFVQLLVEMVQPTELVR